MWHAFVTAHTCALVYMGPSHTAPSQRREQKLREGKGIVQGTHVACLLCARLLIYHITCVLIATLQGR